MNAALLFARDHWSEIVVAALAVLGFLAAAGRAIPASAWAALERRSPWLGEFFRFCRAWGPDAVKGARAAWALIRPLAVLLVRALLRARGIHVVMLALALAGCGGTLRDSAARVSNATASVANAAGPVVLAGYCRAQMRALGREGRWDGARCLPEGPHAADEATDAQRAALAAVRAAWRPVLEGHQVVADAHEALRGALVAADAAGADGGLLARLGELARAYAALARLAARVGLALPAAPLSAGGAQ